MIVTRNRAEQLARTLETVRQCSDEAEVEILVADDGSTDRTLDVLRFAADDSGSPPIRGLHGPARGISKARNEAIAVATAPTVMFLNDDTQVRPGAIARHNEFHRQIRQTGADSRAMVGLTISDPATLDTEFMRWLAGPSLIRWDMTADSAGNVPARLFHGANTSIGTELLRSIGGFDEAIAFGCEDHELGWRLEKQGVGLTHEPRAVISHNHATTLEELVPRLRIDGRGRRILCDRHPEAEAPSRPGLRHRLAAAALTVPFAAHITPRGVRHRAWLYLCHEAYREAFWGEPDPGSPHVRIGARLARMAYADASRSAARAGRQSGTQTAGP